MRLHLVLLPVSLGLLCLGCQDAAPTASPEAFAGLPEGAPLAIDESRSDLPIDGQDEGLRELTAVLTGDLRLKGSVTMPVGYVDSPAIVTQPASTGELALVRLRAVATDATTNRTIYSDIRGPGGAYSSQTLLSDNTSQYKALYVLRNEDLSVRVHNRPSFSGTLHPPAAEVNYTFETKPIQDSAEPNDDENTATVSDRTQGKPLGVGVTATRSFFEFDSVTKDREDWFTTTLQAGSIYRYKFTSYNPRYGTWGYTLKLYNSAGVQVGSTTTVPTGNAGGNLTTPTIPATGTYYLQIVGNPATKSNNSNVFYSLYTITPCEVIQIGSVAFNPSFNGQMCPESVGTWNAEFVGALPETVTASWNFGGGCEPNTSSDLHPTTLLGYTVGSYNGSVTLTSACGARTTKNFTYSVECSWGKSFGQISPPDVSTVTPTAVAVDPQGFAWVTGSFSGSTVLVPVPGGGGTLISGNGGSASNGFIMKFAPSGRWEYASNIAEGSGICQPLDIKLAANNTPWVTGFFYGTLDFDVLEGTNNLTSAGNSDAFLINYTAQDNLVALRFGGTGFDSGEALAIDGNDYPLLTGYYQSTVDFDPGASTFSKTSAGGYDAYLLHLFNDGQFNDWAGFGGTGSDRAYDLALYDNDLYVVGAFSGTTDFDPLANVAAATSAGGDDAFCLKLNRLTYARQWHYQVGAAGTDRAFNVVTDNAGNPRFAGIFASIVDFDNGPADNSRLSYGGNDAFILALSSTGLWNWHAWVGSPGAETITDLVYATGDEIIATGSYEHQGRFDSSALDGPLPNRNASGKDGFVFALDDLNGGLITNDTYGYGGTDSVNAIGIQPLPGAERYLAGTFQEAVDVDPAAGLDNEVELTAVGLVDGWLVRHTAFGTYY